MATATGKSKKSKKSSKKSGGSKKPSTPVSPIAPPNRPEVKLTKSQREKLTCKAIFDVKFRAKLLRTPKAAAASIGISLTRDEIDYIKSLTASEIDELAQDVLGIAQLNMGYGAVNWG